MKKELKQKGISYTITNSCSCKNNSSTYTYSLPFGLDNSICNYLIIFGKSPTSFEKHSIFRIENKDYSIIGVKGLKNIKITIKNNPSLLDKFEDALWGWVESRFK